MVLRDGEVGVELDRLLEVLQSLVLALENGEEEADLILDGGGAGLESGGLLPLGECAGGIAAGLELGGASLDLAKGFLRMEGNCSKSEEEGAARETQCHDPAGQRACPTFARPH